MGHSVVDVIQESQQVTRTELYDTIQSLEGVSRNFLWLPVSIEALDWKLAGGLEGDDGTRRAVRLEKNEKSQGHMNHSETKP